jgi:ribonuclease HII
VIYHEKKAEREGFKFIIGVDEAGCGPLAGPVVASAVILKKKRFKNRIDDSKKLTPFLRQQAFEEILENSIIGLGIVNETDIDTLNILNASHLAMKQALRNLFFKLRRWKNKNKKDRFSFKKTFVLIDGNKLSFKLPCRFKNIIGGDRKSISIASASIVAKVTRDRLMEIYDRIYPEYGFSSHKGYATKRHIQALQRFGPTAIHRKTFSF